MKLFLLVNHLLYFLAVKLHNGFGRWTVYDFFGIRICFRKAMLTLLETSFTVLWMPLAQGTVVRFVDCTFHKPTIFTVVYTLVSILPCTCEPFAL